MLERSKGKQTVSADVACGSRSGHVVRWDHKSKQGDLWYVTMKNCTRRFRLVVVDWRRRQKCYRADLRFKVDSTVFRRRRQKPRQTRQGGLRSEGRTRFGRPQRGG